ncbi:MAG: YdiU family protein [Gemmatimonadales bacterium]|nr:YdiU family protein [Gemmatimonadales bacterium]
MRPITALAFDNAYARLDPAFYDVVDPTPVPGARLLAFNPEAAHLIDLDPAEALRPEVAEYLSGGKRIPGSEPIAQAYAGHQFGVWVARLGDGRAFLLGQVTNARGEVWDLHLKGGGETRFSRRGDGRAVLRSTIREYLGSEALHGLGIPTTRALAIVGSDLPVQREIVEQGATLLRLAPSHVRFGTFEYFASRGERDRIRQLVEHVVARHGPLLGLEPSEPAPFLPFFRAVVSRTATLMAHWTAEGFAHGVMNTDNMSVLGITLDYGPYGWLERYDPGFICNHTDTEGRYAFDQQPAVALWNLTRFGEALLVAAGEPTEAWIEALEGYRAHFAAEYARMMRAKLGLLGERDEDASLLRDLLALMRADRVDYTVFFRRLAEFRAWPPDVVQPAGAEPGALFDDREGWRAWAARYAERLREVKSNDTERATRMRQVNPAYVLRNWIAQEAIERAAAGDAAFIEELRRLFANPYTERQGMDRYAAPAPDGSDEIVVSCSS